jgi:hypothetical protein
VRRRCIRLCCKKNISCISIETTTKIEFLCTHDINIGQGPENLRIVVKMQFYYRYIVKMTFVHKLMARCSRCSDGQTDDFL